MSDLKYWKMQSSKTILTLSSCVQKKRKVYMHWVDTSISTASPRLLLSETASCKKTLLSQFFILITRLKSGAILFWGRCQLIFDKIFPKNATFKLSLMSNDEQKNFIHFWILHIKNIWFLLNLELALVTIIEMKFELVWLGTSQKMFLKS